MSDMLLAMPHIEPFNSREWGHFVVETTRTECTHRTYSIDKTTEPTKSDRSLINMVRIPEGTVETETVPDHCLTLSVDE